MGRAVETLLSMCSGPHNVEANLENMHFYCHMQQLCGSYRTERMPFSVQYPALIIHPWAITAKAQSPLCFNLNLIAQPEATDPCP